MDSETIARCYEEAESEVTDAISNLSAVEKRPYTRSKWAAIRAAEQWLKGARRRRDVWFARYKAADTWALGDHGGTGVGA